MLHTPLCDRLGISVPLIAAPFGPWEQVEVAAAVCRSGGLGSLGTALRATDELEAQWAHMRSLTDRPLAINHTTRPFAEDAFAATLEFRPAAISFHLGVAPDLVDRAHGRGVLWIQQVMDRAQAEEAVAAGVDVIVAQGGEAGGNGGWVSTMVLVPEVVDVAGDVPVVAAGGIADGRGLAAALALGASGVSMGTRFLASEEMAIADEWKHRIVAAGALDAVKVVNAERILPPFTRSGGHAEPRSLRTPLIDVLRDSPDEVDAERVAARLRAALRDGGGHDDIPFTGQSAALIDEVLPVDEIVARLVADAEAAIARSARVPLPYAPGPTPSQGASE